MRQVSKAFYSVALPLLYEVLLYPIRSGPSLLSALRSPRKSAPGMPHLSKPCLGDLVQIIVITLARYDNDVDSSRGIARILGLCGEVQHVYFPPDSASSQIDDDVLFSYPDIFTSTLPTSIRSLHAVNMETLFTEDGEHDHRQHSALFTALSALPNLQTLSMNVSLSAAEAKRLGTILNMQTITGSGLRCLTFGSDTKLPAWFMSTLAASCPKLVTLHFLNESILEAARPPDWKGAYDFSLRNAVASFCALESLTLLFPSTTAIKYCIEAGNDATVTCVTSSCDWLGSRPTLRKLALRLPHIGPAIFLRILNAYDAAPEEGLAEVEYLRVVRDAVPGNAMYETVCVLVCSAKRLILTTLV